VPGLYTWRLQEEEPTMRIKMGQVPGYGHSVAETRVLDKVQTPEIPYARSRHPPLNTK
jgi:hypothetical protein